MVDGALGRKPAGASIRETLLLRNVSPGMRSQAPLDWLFGTLAAVAFLGIIAVPAAFLNARDHGVVMPGSGLLARLTPLRLRLARLIGAIFLGVLVLVLATLLGLFTGPSNLALIWRVLILVGWLALAAVVGAVAARADERMRSDVESQRKAAVVSEHRTLLTQRLDALLAGAFPSNYRVPGQRRLDRDRCSQPQPAAMDYPERAA